MRYDADRAEAWKALLAPEEQARRDAFPAARRRRAFLLGRAAARTLLAERLDVAPCAVMLRVAANGCVEVPGTSWHLSIAHAGAEAVAAVAPRPLGVDIEQVKPRPERLRRFVLHPDERERFARLPLETDDALALWWTLKEAVLKARRSGLRVAPGRLRVAVDWPARSARIAVDDTEHWQARFDGHDGTYLSVAYAD